MRIERYVNRRVSRWRGLAERTETLLDCGTPSRCLATTLTDTAGSKLTFAEPRGITTDGSYLYVVEGRRNEVSRVTVATGEVTVIAGSRTNSGATDGVGTAAAFNAPQGIVIEPQHKALYVADQGNNTIRKIVISTGEVTTIAGATASGTADGVGAAARFNMPADLAMDATGAFLYVSDGENNTIRKIDLNTTQVTTLAGYPGSDTAYSDGVGASAKFSKPWGLATDGTYLYFAGAGDNMIRRLELATSNVKTISGQYDVGSADGKGAEATFDKPEGLTLDATGAFLYVCDSNNNMIRRISLK